MVLLNRREQRIVLHLHQRSFDISKHSDDEVFEKIDLCDHELLQKSLRNSCEICHQFLYPNGQVVTHLSKDARRKIAHKCTNQVCESFYQCHFIKGHPEDYSRSVEIIDQEILKEKEEKVQQLEDQKKKKENDKKPRDTDKNKGMKMQSLKSSLQTALMDRSNRIGNGEHPEKVELDQKKRHDETNHQLISSFT